MSTAEGREAAANQLREQAAEAAKRNRYYEAGLRNDGIRTEIESLQERLNAVSDPEAKMHLENAIEQQREKAILLGKAILEEGEEGKTEEGEGVDEEKVDTSEEESSDAQGDMNDEQEVGQELRDLLEKAASFSERVSVGAARKSMMDERGKIARAIKKIDRLREKRDNPERKSGLFGKIFDGDKKEFDKTMAFLRRCGYSQNGKNSSIFDTFKSEGAFALNYEEGELGKKRAEDYKIAELTAGGEHKRAFQKKLKQEGLKMPESWDDEALTFDEMHRVAQAAKSLYYEQSK